MLIASLCDNSTVLSIIRIVKIILKIVQVILPIILIVSLMLSLTKSISNNDSDALNDFKKKIVPNCIALVAIFLVPNLINITLSLVSTDQNDYTDCLNNATAEKISEIKGNETYNLVEIASSSCSQGDYTRAKTAVNKLENDDLKNSYLNELEVVKKCIDIKKLVDIAANIKNEDNYNKAKEAVATLPDGEVKDNLLKRLESVELALNEDPEAPSSTGCAPDAAKSSDGLTKLHGTSITEVLSKNGSSVEELNKKIKNAVSAVGVGRKYAPAAAAKTLINYLKSYGYKMDYFWGGKYYKIGINPNWGKNIGSSPYCDSHADPACCRVRSIYSSFDCSGFVNWCLINGLQDESIEKQHTSIKSTDIKLSGKTTAVCDIGDVLVNGGHIVLVIGKNNSEKTYQIAESSNGVTIGTKPYDASGYYCRKLSSLYTINARGPR